MTKGSNLLFEPPCWSTKTEKGFQISANQMALYQNEIWIRLKTRLSNRRCYHQFGNRNRRMDSLLDIRPGMDNWCDRQWMNQNSPLHSLQYPREHQQEGNNLECIYHKQLANHQDISCNWHWFRRSRMLLGSKFDLDMWNNLFRIFQNSERWPVLVCGPLAHVEP